MASNDTWTNVASDDRSHPTPEPSQRTAPAPIRRYRFGDFELDLDAMQLRARGEPVKLERRPLDLLVLLVSRHGRMVGRDEIITALWPTNVIIDFDSGLNTLVRKVRAALGDSPDDRKFVETVPGRGYRFVAAVTDVAPRYERQRRTRRYRHYLTTNPPLPSRRKRVGDSGRAERCLRCSGR